jgi:short-subunit dehydrogenase
MKDIGGRTAVITGASRGLGAAIAADLFDHGMKVVLAARSGDELEAVRRGFDPKGVRSLTVSGDVTSESDRRALLAAATEKFDGVDVLVNNAGSDHPESFLDADLDRIQRMIDLNLVSLMRLTQLVLPDMLRRGSGHVVNMSSVAGLAPVPYGAVYATTKHGVIGFSDSLRAELAGSGVSVSTVCPYYVRESGMYHDNTSGDSGRVSTVSPQDVADAVRKAIVNDRARIVVGPPEVVMAPVLRAISPSLLDRIARMQGGYAEQQRMAESVREREHQPSGNGATDAAPKRKSTAAGKP